MSKLRIQCFGLSIDGYGAGPAQDLDNPLGVGGEGLHEWMHASRTFREMLGLDGGDTGPEDDFICRGFENVGAWILGRNMFGPHRGPWNTDEEWKGWWGDNPPYRCDVFVLTHHPRESFTMQGGTTFHFVTEGIEAALDRAKKAAKGKDVRLGGGVSAIRQYFRARLVDEAHFAISQTLLGHGEPLFSGLDLPVLGYETKAFTATPHAAHILIGRR